MPRSVVSLEGEVILTAATLGLSPSFSGFHNRLIPFNSLFGKEAIPNDSCSTGIAP
jgi:hypothetical protein